MTTVWHSVFSMDKRKGLNTAMEGLSKALQSSKKSKSVSILKFR